MTSLRLILASLLHHWRTNLAVAFGVAAGTAVLTGALLVGDSMRGSLRRLTLDRLGRIEEVLTTDRFFRAALADELGEKPEFKEHFAEAAAAVLLRGSLENSHATPPRRANAVNLIGCEERFWQFGSGGPITTPQENQIVLNRPLALRLGVKRGDSILLRLPRPGLIPADSPLGQKSETVQSRRVTVSAIIEAEGLGRFSLRASQHLPRNAYVSLDWLAEELDQPDRANAILVTGRTAADPTPQSEGVVQDLLQPALADYGIRLQQTGRGYFNITFDRMLFPPAAEDAILKALSGYKVQPVLTYLANSIACGERETPYSTISAVDFSTQSPLGPFVTPQGETIDAVPDGRIVLNSWAAEDLQAKPGDTVRVTFFEPESSHGEVSERTVELTLAAVADLSQAADDPDFTPQVPGVTDQLSMAQWNPPFPFDAARIRDRDERYWDDHAATPKAFVSLRTGRRLWESRFGCTTSLRVRPEEGMSVESLADQLALEPAAMGFVFQPLKRQNLQASVGTLSGLMSFSGLFVAFSFFIIAAAVILVALLFRLGIEQRAEELGILAAVGFRRWKIVRLLAGEGFCVAVLGSLIGVPAGVGYAAFMLLGLRTWWLAAVVTPFLRLYVTTASLLIGLVSGVIVAQLAIAWTVWRTGRIPPRQLLLRQTIDTAARFAKRSRYAAKLAGLLLIAAIALGLFAAGLSELAQAGAFFAAGTMVLLASLIWVWDRLRAGSTGPAVKVGRGNLLRMALRNAARNPGRSTLTIGLVALACFLIVALSAFYLDPTQHALTLASGNGGFALVAESDQPIYHDFNTPDGAGELGFSEDDQKQLAQTRTIPLRVKPGDDASCLNLYKPRQPRVLGVPRQFIDRGGFAWTGSAASTPAQQQNPWLLLNQQLEPDAGTPVVPVVIDMDTAIYSLHLFTGVGETYDITDGRGRTVRLKVVGLLARSIFQGDLLISETAFKELFPEVSGYRFFLTESPPGQTGEVGRTLERTLGDYGLATETTGTRLAGFLAVQNTYLLTFQSLGGLGLLLGTFALAAVQLRNVLERRSELALLRAAGFRRATLAEMVMLENALLLLAGLGCGVLAALVAVLPHLIGQAAAIPFWTLAVTLGSLGLVLVVGVTVGLCAVRSVLIAPLLATLKQER